MTAVLLSAHKAENARVFSKLWLAAAQLHWLTLQARAAGIPLEGYLAQVVDQVRQRLAAPAAESPEDRAARDRLLAAYAERVEQLPGPPTVDLEPVVVRLSAEAEAAFAAARYTERAALEIAIRGQLAALAVPTLAVAAAAWKRDHGGEPAGHLVGWLVDLGSVAAVA